MKYTETSEIDIEEKGRTTREWGHVYLTQTQDGLKVHGVRNNSEAEAIRDLNTLLTKWRIRGFLFSRTVTVSDWREEIWKSGGH